ncbi:hypothetical protein EVAR_43753_1 [Eumeta japonica]|uniref:Uncharacterized protein n=1 Tax=Eumeta variegata TaxID=151549 RepID=A0A4C1XLA6_EUMVA|nr:hypothetical protein EVAR_43753_1 [Eumeta japonica]
MKFVESLPGLESVYESRTGTGVGTKRDRAGPERALNQIKTESRTEIVSFVYKMLKMIIAGPKVDVAVEKDRERFRFAVSPLFMITFDFYLLLYHVEDDGPSSSKSELRALFDPREGKQSKQARRWTDDIRKVGGATWMRKTRDRKEWKQLEEAYVSQDTLITTPGN